MAALTKVEISFLIDRYDALAFDAFGVLLDESGPGPGAARLLAHLNAIQKPYWIVTNGSSRALGDMVSYYQSMGLPITSPRLITSGCLLSGHFVRENLVGKRVAVLGTDGSRRMVAEAGAIPVDLLSGEDFDVVVVSNQTEFPFLDSVDTIISHVICAREVGRRIPLVLTNPDLVYPKGQGRYGITSGAIALMIESVLELRFPADPANRFFKLGKPFSPIFEELSSRAGTKNIVMIGDQIETDIKGARAFGLDTVLYTRGVTNPVSVKFVTGSDSCPDFLLDDLWSGEPDR